jgi:LacI family transcriptional regulator
MAGIMAGNMTGARRREPGNVIVEPRPRARIEDVARRAGVSIATVSRVLNSQPNRASAATAERVRAAAAALSYRPAHAGRALRLQQTRLIALLVPDTTNAFYAAIAKSIEASLTAQNYAMILCNTAEDPELQDAYLAEMQAHHVRGVALLGAVPSPGLDAAIRAGLPVAFVNRRSPIGGGIFVGIDNEAAGRAVADHFVAHGFSDCAVIHGPLNSSASRGRFEGYCERLQERGIVLPADRILGAALTMSSGYEMARRLLQPPSFPRAIFCGNDQIAYGVFRRCRELALCVPSEIALFGFDDNPLNEWLAPWLSTVHVPHDQFGPAVSRALNQLWSEPGRDCPEILLDFSIVLRGSAE